MKIEKPLIKYFSIPTGHSRRTINFHWKTRSFWKYDNENVQFGGFKRRNIVIIITIVMSALYEGRGVISKQLVIYSVVMLFPILQSPFIDAFIS